jgi:hypothetical protein
VDDGRKRVLGIIAGILVARHMKTMEDLFDSKHSPRIKSLVAAAVGQNASCARSIRSLGEPNREKAEDSLVTLEWRYS